MDFNSPTPSSNSSILSTSTPKNPNNNNNNNSASNNSSSDPIHSWWEQISKARSSIQTLSTLLPFPISQTTLSLADTDRPAFSLLNSFQTYSSLSQIISSPNSGNANDPLCHFLYDTYLSSNHHDLRLVVLSYLPLLIHTYLTRTYHPNNYNNSNNNNINNGNGNDTGVVNVVSLSGFEAVLLALYSAETKLRNGRPVLVQIPDLGQPSLYHSPRNGVGNGSGSGMVGVLSPALEPQNAIKSTKRECIVGVAFDCYYKHVSQMPSWSKVDFCKFVTRWAGKECPCVDEEEDGDVPVDFVEEGVRGVEIVAEEEKEERIPLGWEMLQPVLRILGHCLLGPMNGEDVKEEAGVAVRRLYARASHDLVPQAILATGSLVRLDRKRKESVRMGGEENGMGSNVNTPSKAKKPEILLVSK